MIRFQLSTVQFSSASCVTLRVSLIANREERAWLIVNLREKEREWVQWYSWYTASSQLYFSFTVSLTCRSHIEKKVRNLSQKNVHSTQWHNLPLIQVHRQSCPVSKPTQNTDWEAISFFCCSFLSKIFSAQQNAINTVVKQQQARGRVASLCVSRLTRGVRERIAKFNALNESRDGSNFMERPIQ